MVVLHGLGAAATPFGPVLTRLQRHARRVVAIELPGHGFSATPPAGFGATELLGAMREALDAVLDEPAVVCGNSLGGAVALRYALDRPERVRGLVLTSPAGAPLSDDELATLRSGFDLGTDADARAFMARLYHRRPWFGPIVAGEVRTLMHRPVIRDLLASARADDAPTPPELAALRPPTLLWWGRSERLLPPSGLAYLRANLPAHAVVEEPEGLGHCPHIDDPARLAERIVTFARTLEA